MDTLRDWLTEHPRRHLHRPRRLDAGLSRCSDGAKGFLAGPDDEASAVLEVPGLRVLAASPRILLAMKVLAHRIGEDDDDVRLLAGELGLADAAKVLAPAEEVYGDQLDAAARFFVEELFSAEP